MLIKVQKQVEETLEVDTPCYYRGITGFHYINGASQLITVVDRFISISDPKDGKYYNDEIERIVRTGKPCQKEEFEKAYSETIAKIGNAVMGADNPAIAFINEAEGLGALAE